MATANAPENPTANREEIRDQWLQRLADLIQTVEGWAKELGWATRRIEKKLEDSQIGTYRAPVLLLQEGTSRLILEPIARSAPGVEGVVDLYRMPAYDDIASLYYYDAGWQLHYPVSGAPAAGTVRVARSKPLSRDTLREVLAEITRNAA